MKPATTVATLFFSIIALLHLLRVVFQVPVTVGSFEIPIWASMIGFVGAGLLAVWLWKEQKG